MKIHAPFDLDILLLGISTIGRVAHVTIVLCVAGRDWEQFKYQYLQWNSCTVEYHATVTKSKMERKVLKCANKETLLQK